MIALLEAMPALCSLGLGGCAGGAALAAAMNRTELPSLHRDFEVSWNAAGAAAFDAAEAASGTPVMCSLQSLSIS